MTAMIRANDKIERAWKVERKISAIQDASKLDDPWFYFTKAQLRKAFPKALLIEADHEQITVIDHDLTKHEN